MPRYRCFDRVAPLLLLTSLVAGCGRATLGADDTIDGLPAAPGAGSPSDDWPAPDGPTVLPDVCADLGLVARPFAEGPYGIHRSEVAEDLEVALVDGSSWRLRAVWSGCESYVFIPDTLSVSDRDPTSLWERDLDALIESSPPNAQYFFVSRADGDDAAAKATASMQARIDEVVRAASDEKAAARLRDRLHVVAPRAGAIDGWIRDVLRGHGRRGFAIDRLQRVRGMGNLADVTRYDSDIYDPQAWPWSANLAYAANEAIYFNGEAERQARLDAENAKVVPLWSGETLAEFAEVDVSLPSAEEMARFDTLEVEVTMACPDPEAIEFGNCGAWDYIASLAVEGDAGNIELARFITSYHRETHWVVDATPMLALLKEGGARRFRWDFAPSWNQQPTRTRLSLRLSNRGVGVAPAVATFLYGGGPFNSAYNATRAPIEVPIPPDARRVEIVSIVTGHGGAVDNCAEFCDHQHEFTVNGAPRSRAFPMAGTDDGCMAEIGAGMVPNQGGTWWFGRGGWCPGKQVDPWIEDVTDAVTPGSTATISYRGLYRGGTPPDDAGDINLASYLVVYR